MTIFEPMPAASDTPPLHGASRRAVHSRIGSVLMETLLVLPLLLMLLGGLFILGDILLARLVSHDMDRTAAWVGGGTVYRGDLEKSFGFALGLDAGTAFGWSGLRLDKSRLSPSGYFAKQPKDPSDSGNGGGGGIHGNAWIDFYAGRADTEIGVPFWVPLLDVQENTIPHADGTPPERTASLWKLHTDTTGFPDPAGRVALFRRRRQSIAPSFAWYRGKPAAGLDLAGALFDAWPGVGQPKVVEAAAEADEPYRRHPVAVIIGE